MLPAECVVVLVERIEDSIVELARNLVEVKVREISDLELFYFCKRCGILSDGLYDLVAGVALEDAVAPGAHDGCATANVYGGQELWTSLR